MVGHGHSLGSAGAHGGANGFVGARFPHHPYKGLWSVKDSSGYKAAVADGDAPPVSMETLRTLVSAATNLNSSQEAIREAFAAIAHLARVVPHEIGPVIQRHLRPLSNPTSSASKSSSSRAHAHVTDVLACVYYLRCCGHVAFAPLSAWSGYSGNKARDGARCRTSAYWVLVAALSDPRERVALEALGLLTRVSDHPSAW